MDHDEWNLWRSSQPEKHLYPICPPFSRPYAWHVSDASDFSSCSEPSLDQELPQEKVVRNKDHRACDRCRELRYKCEKVSGEECSLCTKCANSGQGPMRGTFKRTLTLRNTPFSKRRALSPADYKQSLDRPISLADKSKYAAPIDAEIRIVQPSVNPTDPCSGLQSENGSGHTFSCSEDVTSGSSRHILNPPWSCIPKASGSKSLGTDIPQNAQRLKDRNKKHLFAD
ncbi:hypothetical protein C8J55DRAFT_281632 [Lentinula edodes]|uniref:Zn(2)-C6 fungal-type domain-containing protein n=1 Tax=Lentinula lateritia TaxID=40482 RepID=A0A9W9AXX7_9AGAR|nr:hypothetical protein C8J55DRAFT_281632 [Lentinula edodes]